MTERRGARNDRREAGRYEVRVRGHLDGRWAAAFDESSFTHEEGGQTVIHGPVADQAALHGLLQRVRDIGLSLVSVTRVEDDVQASEVDARPLTPGSPEPERNDEP